MAKLRAECRKVKEQLSFCSETDMNIDSLKNDEDLCITITQGRF